MFRNTYLHLFLALVSFLVIPPFLDGEFVKHIFISILFTIILFSTIFIIYDKRKKNIVPVFVIFTVIILTWTEYLIPQHKDFVSAVSYFLLFGFFIYVTLVLFGYLFRQQTINQNVFLVCMSIYLLMGINGALLFTALNSLYPGAFDGGGSLPLTVSDFLYFGFVTMATVGYGDITPAIPQTQMVAVMLAVIGQIYLTIIVAILVGKYISQKKDDTGSLS
ncbi:MAG: hypothetical protein KKA81_06080 [Bacteroidetes bacterium]|nr:hypothetical protein [Bacteroidota bacterium]